MKFEFYCDCRFFLCLCRVVTPSSSYLELPNSTWPFSSKVHEITKFRISWSNSWKKLRFDQVRFAKIFKSWLIAKNEHRLGRFACSTKLVEVPNRGPWAKSLSLSDYSGLFWSEKSKLMKYKYVFIKCCSTISLLKSKYFGHLILTWSSTLRKLWVQLVYLLLLWRAKN